MVKLQELKEIVRQKNIKGYSHYSKKKTADRVVEGGETTTG